MSEKYKDNWLIYKKSKIKGEETKDLNLLCDIYLALKDKYIHLDNSSSLNKLYENLNNLSDASYLNNLRSGEYIIDFIKKIDVYIIKNISKINNKNDLKNILKKIIDIDWNSIEYLNCI